MASRAAILFIRAITKGRPRMSRRGRRVFTPARTLHYEREVAALWDDCFPDEAPFTGPVGISITIGSNHVEIEVYELAEKLRPKYQTGDLDNLVKSIGDALQGHAYENDKQIHELEVRFTRDDIEAPDEEEGSTEEGSTPEGGAEEEA